MADIQNTKYNFLDYEGLALFWNNVKNIIDTDKIETNNALTNLDIRVDTVEGALANQIISITYAELKTLRDSGQLVPGQQYRITDYQCTTTQEGTKSAGHQFDIIVTADDENTLNEVARAIQHTGDEYFANSDLNAWNIWYCLDNDSNRFDWADETNGKGVIYRMIDEFNNDVPYDFKNIQFYRQWDSSKSLWSTISSDNTGVPCYTFSSKGDGSTTSFTDNSLDASNTVYSNVIKEYVNSNKQTLNNNCFFGTNCSSNTFSTGCHHNTFGSPPWCICRNNTFGHNFNNNSFGYGCDSNSFGNYCDDNTFGNDCHSNKFGDRCSSNKFGDKCSYNSFENDCRNNIFGDKCSYNSFENDCYNNTFGNDCSENTVEYNCWGVTFGDKCSSNYLGKKCYNIKFGLRCSHNSFGNACNYTEFGNHCTCNTFGNGCSTYFGNDCNYNSFGNDCNYSTFRVSASPTSALKDYVQYNHVDDGCSYNVIWNSNTTASNLLLQNINVNRGVVGTSNSYNMINIDVLNSEKEINVNQVNGIVSISNIPDIVSDISDVANKLDKKLDKIIEINYADLVILRDSSKLVPGQQYRIIDYITTTSQENTQSAGHQFDIIVTALDESTLSEEAQAIQNNIEGYFDGSNLSAWKIWYCLDNDTNRFAWAGGVKVGEIEHKSYDSSQCTIKPELINGNAFTTPFNFESCVWVDGNNDGLAYSDDHIHHDISELIYEWGYFTDDNGVKQLCIYKSDADLYAGEGQPDYGDKYLYRGVVNVDGAEYDYWQKWDADGGIHVGGSDDYVYATTQRIVSNPEAYSVTTVTEDIYGPGKGVIYRMIDEWNNDIPYDFKNIQFNGDWGYWAYTFNWINDNSDNSCEDLSVAQYAYTNDEGGYSHTYGNVIKPCEDASSTEYGYPLKLNNIVFLNTESYDSGFFYGCHCNTLENNCYNNSFRNNCNSNSFGNYCTGNSFRNSCKSNTFGNDCRNNSFVEDCCNNSFGNYCSGNSFGNGCYNNTFGNGCGSNSFGNGCYNNTFGNGCDDNSFGNNCKINAFGNNCWYNSFRVSASPTAALKDFAYYNYFDDGCSYNVIWNSDTTSSNIFLKNINVNRGVRGAINSYNMININTLNQDYEIQVAKNTKGEIKIYCEADLIA